jgi:hypothetical protein
LLCGQGHAVTFVKKLRTKKVLRRFRGQMLAVVAAFGAPAAEAVYLNADGQGQALIFPYYTVRDGRGGTFNTYLSVVNPTSDAKALRVRFREGRNGKPVGDVNLYLGPNDVWTAAMVSSAAGTIVQSLDYSCTDPVVGAGDGRPAFALTNAAFSGANDDGAGTGLDRTREGYVEVLEMAVLTGASATATKWSGVTPPTCAGLGAVPALDTGTPTGGLSGSLTLINVADGSDYSVNATALADVFTAALYRPVNDPYPDFRAAEVSTASAVTAKGGIYRSEWPTGLDAVNAALMAAQFDAEYVLDAATRSATDLVMTFPTRPLSVTAASARPPFRTATQWNASCRSGEIFSFFYANREQAGAYSEPGDLGAFMPDWKTCGSVAVVPVTNGSTQATLLGSILATTSNVALFTSGMQNGFLHGDFARIAPAPIATSLASSTRIDIATGATRQGSHTYVGLPVVGFMVRSLQNGRLDCNGAFCQGNYGSAFPLRVTRSVTAN